MSDYPDFSTIALLKGFYNGTPTPLAVDADGNLSALLNAESGGLPVTLQCDATGNIEINLNAQDLAQVITRDTYGAADYTKSEVSFTGTATKDIISVSGQGMVYNNLLVIADSNFHDDDKVLLTVDGTSILNHTIGSIKDRGIYGMHRYIYSILKYDQYNGQVTMNFTQNFTFESSYLFQYYHSQANTLDVLCDFFCALI